MDQRSDTRPAVQGAIPAHVARARRLHISDYRLPAIIDVNVLDADILVSAVTEAAKGMTSLQPFVAGGAWAIAIRQIAAMVRRIAAPSRQHREKPADVVGAASAHLQQVHAGGKDVPLPG
jgi:hypothetical protein